MSNADGAVVPLAALSETRQEEIRDSIRSRLEADHGIAPEHIKEVHLREQFGRIVFDVEFNNIDRAVVARVSKRLSEDMVLGEFALDAQVPAHVAYREYHDEYHPRKDPRDWDEDGVDDYNSDSADSTELSDRFYQEESLDPDAVDNVSLAESTPSVAQGKADDENDDTTPPSNEGEGALGHGTSNDTDTARKASRRASMLSIGDTSEQMPEPALSHMYFHGAEPVTASATAETTVATTTRAFVPEDATVDDILHHGNGRSDDGDGDGMDVALAGLGSVVSDSSPTDTGMSSRQSIEAKAFALEALLETMILREETDRYNQIMDELADAKAAIDKTIEVGRLELQYRLEEFLKEEFQRHVRDAGGADPWVSKQSAGLAVSHSTSREARR